ncbi:MAG: C40 family peptidase [Chitinophagales bacterium]|nr:C40 family peptidase [Chitinophagales bacterium]
MDLKGKYSVKLLIMVLVIFTFAHPAFAAKKKKKNSTKPKTTVSLTKRDSVFRKPVPFDLDYSTYKAGTKDENDIIWFAKQQLGTPYKYASANPKNGGLDCSGFLYYVFTHFNIKVPRSSKDYMSYGTTINKNEAKKGDVIVFTGTDASQRIGGHVGLVLENNNGELTFIHGSSGKANGVTISKLSEGYYSKRFLKVIRVL